MNVFMVLKGLWFFIPPTAFCPSLSPFKMPPQMLQYASLFYIRGSS